MPTADRIDDRQIENINPGQCASKDLCDTDMQPLVQPALRVLQLNVEGLSAAKLEVISCIAEKEINVSCSEETNFD